MKTYKAFLVAVYFVCSAFADTVVVPPNNANQAGDSSSQPLFRFGATEQFVYGRKNFNAPVQITAIAFRPDEDGRSSMDMVIPNFTIRMTTYQGTPQRLSGDYSANRAGDDTQVFSGSVHWIGSGLFGTGPNPFLMQIPLSTPFLYNPSQGDLLLYCVSSGPTLQSNFALADAASHGDLTIGYTYSGGGGFGSSGFSPIIQFTTVAVPEPGVMAFLTGGVLLLRTRQSKAKTGLDARISGPRIRGF